MKYFNIREIKCIEDLKKVYFTLAQRLHPDHDGGSEEEFKILNSEYQALHPKFKDIHRSMYSKEETEAKGRKWEEFYTAKTPCSECADEFINIVTALLRFNDMTVELCGRWLYIRGNTKEHREMLKGIGCKYAPKKSPDCWTWHYAEDSAPRKKRRHWSMSKIRDVYGSETYFNDEKLMIAGA